MCVKIKIGKNSLLIKTDSLVKETEKCIRLLVASNDPTCPSTRRAFALNFAVLIRVGTLGSEAAFQSTLQSLQFAESSALRIAWNREP